VSRCNSPTPACSFNNATLKRPEFLEDAASMRPPYEPQVVVDRTKRLLAERHRKTPLA
jgi:hypothetical protein